MTGYRRIHIPGSTWFFTVNLAEHQNNHLGAEKLDLLRTAFHYLKESRPYRINTVIIMRDNLLKCANPIFLIEHIKRLCRLIDHS
ncbi:MAG: hypothetical protein ACXWTW_08650 [Methylobacter sp.]